MLLFILKAVSLTMWLVMLFFLCYRLAKPWNHDLELHSIMLDNRSNPEIQLAQGMRTMSSHDTLRIQVEVEEADRYPLRCLLEACERSNPAILIQYLEPTEMSELTPADKGQISLKRRNLRA